MTKFKAGDTIKHDQLTRKLWNYKGRLGYTSSYGNFVPLSKNDLEWELVKSKPVTFGQKLKEVRKASNMTQRQLDIKSGISSDSICRYETDARSPKLETVALLANGLGVTASELIEGVTKFDK